jgi:formiminoglutamase
LIDLNLESPFKHENFLMDMLTGEPNFIRHYNHIGFQSYFVHPRMLETMDKLHFDCYRVGSVKENIDEMEPVIRNSNLFSFDMTAMAHAYAPANSISPNGFNGEEACVLMRYAGMSPNVNSIGIYGYDAKLDKDELTAKQISHMLWYVLDGRSRGRREAQIDERDSFNEYHMAFAEVETIFLQSKKTGRWWMQLPDKKFIACSYKDYLLASSNEIPERWLRAQERS